MRKRLAALLVAVAASQSFADQIDGDIFIVTKGKGAVKLPLVQVSVYSEDAMAKHLARLSKDGQEVLDYLQRAIHAREEYYSKFIPEEPESQTKWEQLMGLSQFVGTSNWFFSSRPKEVEATTKTDADGKFSITVPAGNYVVVARSSRSVGDSTEYYSWAVRAKAGVHDLHLANDNMSDSGSSDSAISGDAATIKSIVATKGEEPIG